MTPVGLNYEGEMESDTINKRMLETLKKAYRKHVLNDDSIGWEELGEDMCSSLCEAMTDKGFQKWLKTIRDTKS